MFHVGGLVLEALDEVTKERVPPNAAAIYGVFASGTLKRFHDLRR